MIVFLDLDGVLIHEGRAFQPARGNVSKEAMDAFNQLVKDIDAEVVFISNRRRFGNPENLKTILRQEGFEGKFHDDFCIRTSLVPLSRGKGIDDWCARNSIASEDYIILDDKTRGLAPHHIERLMRTDTNRLLTLENVAEICSTLAQQTKPERGQSL